MSVIKEAFFKLYPERDYSFYEFIMDAFFLDEAARSMFYKGETLHKGRMGVIDAVDYLRLDLLPKIEEMERRMPDDVKFIDHWSLQKDDKMHAVLFVQQSARARNKLIGRVFPSKSIAFYIDTFGVSIFDAVRFAEEFFAQQLSTYANLSDEIRDGI